MNLITSSKYQKHVACSFGYKLICVDDKFSKFSIMEDSKYCIDIMKKHFNKELMNQKDNEDFKDPIKCWICNNAFVEGDVKVRDHCHITGKYRGSAHRDCNINVKLNQKNMYCIPQHNSYDSYLIMQELGKINF